MRCIRLRSTFCPTDDCASRPAYNRKTRRDAHAASVLLRRGGSDSDRIRRNRQQANGNARQSDSHSSQRITLAVVFEVKPNPAQSAAYIDTRISS
jgi:hypothetical protein